MYGWFLWCALAGFILGTRCPFPVIVAVAAIALPTGFIYQLWSGFDIAILTAIGGFMVLQVSYMVTVLAVAMVTQRPANVLLALRSRTGR